MQTSKEMYTFVFNLPFSTLPYFKTTFNPSCIDLFITNSPLGFQNTMAISSRLSDFSKMVVIIVMKMSFEKHSHIETLQRYKYFDQTKFKSDLDKKLSAGISNYESFETTLTEVLNKHDPLGKKFLRGNHAPYLTKTLRKDIMHRS